MVGAENYDISLFGLYDRRSSSELSAREIGAASRLQPCTERGLNPLPLRNWAIAAWCAREDLNLDFAGFEAAASAVGLHARLVLRG